jgi:SAM-dependent methyltransferase
MLRGVKAGESFVPIDRRLKRVPIDPTTLELDAVGLDAIVADLRENGGVFTPTANWLTLDPGPGNANGSSLLESCFDDEGVQARMSTMSSMLRSWIGFQTRPAAGGPVETYEPFLSAHDPLGLWERNVLDEETLAQLIDTDLGSIMDLSLIASLASPMSSPVRILEVGGGYGRLAEAASNVFGDGVRYVLVDSVPASLLYARDYLRRACPDRRVGFYYDEQPFDLEAFDIAIVPSWRLEEVNRSTYDVCVNIESFQEMAQKQVDRYLSIFDEVGAPGGLIYLSNAYDYAFRGEWRFPPYWRRVLCTNTPRSWTQDHPTEAFVKETADCTRWNGALAAAYRSELARAQA